MATSPTSSPTGPGSPTGTLKRENAKKDAMLGWVGTLTRRKKGQEGKLDVDVWVGCRCLGSFFVSCEM